ncbi:hypothetical protein [Shewanella chilikensis]|uniref:hypothetical protein n=1 Tax=Shewanella chilikensis TaxID=558541 RepID=UPI003A978582
MKRMFKLVLIIAMAFPVTAMAQLFGFFDSGTSEDLQHDFDIARLNDLEVLSGYIEQYHSITGKYPFQGEVDYPHYVHIATQEQQKYAQGGPPYEHKKTPSSDLLRELVSVLGDEISVPFDPQRMPVNKPNFYIYMVVDDVYFLAVHLHNDFPFAQKVANYYYKVEVTSNAIGNRPGTWLRADLLSDPQYIEAASAAPIKPGYVEELRNKLGGNDAF